MVPEESKCQQQGKQCKNEYEGRRTVNHSFSAAAHALLSVVL